MEHPSAPFDRNVERWREYGASLKGRLRQALVLEQLAAHLPAAPQGLRVLDVGCGLAETAQALLPRSSRMVLLDFSAAMLAQARARLASACPPEQLCKLELVQADLQAAPCGLPQGPFDLILCHGVLEYLPDGSALPARLSSLLAPGGLLSLLAPNRFGEALQRALAGGDLEAALRALEGRSAAAGLFDRIPKQTFVPAELAGMLETLGLRLTACLGVRFFCDYLPQHLCSAGEKEAALLQLERAASALPEAAAVARYCHLIARREPAAAAGR